MKRETKYASKVVEFSENHPWTKATRKILSILMRQQHCELLYSSQLIVIPRMSLLFRKIYSEAIPLRITKGLILL